jgi:hypothetical protein
MSCDSDEWMWRSQQFSGKYAAPALPYSRQLLSVWSRHVRFWECRFADRSWRIVFRKNIAAERRWPLRNNNFTAQFFVTFDGGQRDLQGAREAWERKKCLTAFRKLLHKKGSQVPNQTVYIKFHCLSEQGELRVFYNSVVLYLHIFEYNLCLLYFGWFVQWNHNQLIKVY